jgi:hypothetical protein
MRNYCDKYESFYKLAMRLYNQEDTKSRYRYRNHNTNYHKDTVVIVGDDNKWFGSIAAIQDFELKSCCLCAFH